MQNTGAAPRRFAGASSVGSANGQLIDAQCGLADTDREALPLFAADPHPQIKLKIISHHADPRQYLWPVANQGGAFTGRVTLPCSIR